jgi:hypothetical protein
MNYVNLALTKFGVVIKPLLIPIFVAKVLFFLSQGNDVTNALKKAIMDILPIKL